MKTRTLDLAASTRIYRFESELVDDLFGALNAPQCPWAPVSAIKEFDYQNGRTDVLALTQDGSLVAFEAKLTRWRWAAHQAYRNTSFAQQSLVVLPESTVRVAMRERAFFEQRSVGLCHVSASGLVIDIAAPHNQPLSSWLREKAIDMIVGNGKLISHSGSRGARDLRADSLPV